VEDVVQDANEPDGRALGTVFMSGVAITQQRWYRYWLSSRSRKEAAEGRAFEPITNIDRGIATVILDAIEGRLAHTMTVVIAKQVRAIHGGLGAIRRLRGTLHGLARASVCLRVLMVGK